MILNKRGGKFLIFTTLVIVIILVPIYTIGGFYAVHHVCNSMLYDAIKIAIAGKLPDAGFPAITPVPYLHAAILYITTGLQILQLNAVYLILFQLIVGVFTLILLDRAIGGRTKEAFKLALIIIVIATILYWNVYPDVIYEYGFHHQWYGVYLVAFVTIFLSLYLHLNWGKTLVSLCPFLVSIPLTHPFAEVILLTFLITALAVTLLAHTISSVRLKERSHPISPTSLLAPFIVMIIVTYLNDVLMSLVLREYVPLVFERLKAIHGEILNYLDIMLPAPAQDPLVTLSSIGFKYFVFILNVIFPFVYAMYYLAGLMRKQNCSDLYEDRHFIFALAFSLSLVLYPVANIFLRYLSFAFVQRYLYFLFILVILNGILLLSGSIRQKVLEEKKFGKVVTGTVLIILAALLSGLFSTLMTLSSRVPLALFYSAHRAHVVDLNLYLAHHLAHAVTLTPGYYIMPQYLKDKSIIEIAIYTYRADCALQKLLETDIIILDVPCQGVCYQLRSAGLYSLDHRKLHTLLMHTHNLIYNNGRLELLLKVT